MNVNNVFVTGYSLNLSSFSSYSDYQVELLKLDSFVDSIPNYNNLDFCQDFLEYDLGGESLDDILYEVSGFNDPKYTEMLKEISFLSKGKKNGNYTNAVMASADIGQVWNNEFISFYSQGKTIPNISPGLIVDSLTSLYRLNYSNLSNLPISEESFTNRAKLMFSNISYHAGFESTLSTVKSGNFRLYSVEFTRALEALHNAFPKLTNKGNNQDDLVIISNEAAKSGRSMSCTVQGSNKLALKKNFDLETQDGKIKSFINLNCEYHLKINFDNNGNKLQSGFYNRAYFGLPLINGKKYIALLHLGKHL
ncbi:hypothetical protein [Vibrio coralliilyticus]|uniref:hypothetical protein n=1 Tax=Vibrio coralliilyticus TaxID=190893 RepID=UPI00148C7173|nr:hypothetical protein [Vibrio coralliilyticus]NOI27847.1 hypothetical protein [Vibrio coralliilyticus]NOI50809.1 hypothetical protein [Vibrio coralliilyticus]